MKTFPRKHFQESNYFLCNLLIIISGISRMKPQTDFSYLVKMALQNRLPWRNLAMLLNDDTLTLIEIREVISISLSELETLNLAFQEKQYELKIFLDNCETLEESGKFVNSTPRNQDSLPEKENNIIKESINEESVDTNSYNMQNSENEEHDPCKKDADKTLEEIDNYRDLLMKYHEIKILQSSVKVN